MAFALFYNREDLGKIAAQLARVDLDEVDRPEADLFWDNGFYKWDTYPLAKSDRIQGDAETREVVISGSGLTKDRFRALLYKIANNYEDIPGMAVGDTEYMNAIGDDVELSAAEPWSSGGN